MAGIGGNIVGTVFAKKSSGRNSIGESITEWIEAATQIGWLGLQTGDSDRSNFNTKIEKSTHVFLCDYNPIIYALADQDIRMMIKSRMYDVLMIDNPDEMDEQLEIYLKYVGGQENVSNV